MSEFHDPEMENLLGRAGGAFPDVNTAYSMVQGRVRQVKRRRAMVAGTAACLLLAGGVVLGMGRDGGRANLSPADGGTGVVVDTDPSDDSTLSTDPSGTTDSTTNASGNTTGSSSNGSSPSTSDGGSTNSTTATTDAPTTSASTPTGPVQQQYDSVGGSIVVRLSNGTLTLVSTSPAAGFAIDSSTATGNRVEVRFRSATHDSKIRIDLTGGVMVPRIDENP